MKLKKALLIYTTEFLIIVIVLLMVLGQYSVIASNDGYHQNYMVMVYMGKLIREFCSNLLHGSFVVPQFDFAIGLGEGIMLPTNFYGLGDPFLVLSALCPVAYSAYFYTCIYLLKIYCSGLAFMYYCRVRKAEYEYILIGTIAYIGSYYMLVQGLLFPIPFVNIMITLPIICAGIDKVIESLTVSISNPKRKVRISAGLILAIGFQAWSGFYSLYMELLFVAIYALICVLSRTREVEKIIEIIVHLFLQVLWGIAVGAIVLIPAICGYMSSGRVVSEGAFDWKSLFAFDWNIYWEIFSNLIIPSEQGGHGLGIPILGIVAIVLAFKKNKNGKDIKIFATILGILYFNIRVTSWIAGGFSRAIYYGRWLFILSFISSYLIVLGSKYFKDIKIHKWAIGTIIYFLILISGIGMINRGNWDNKVLKIVALYVVVSSIILFYIHLGKKISALWINKYLFQGLMLLGIVLNICIVYKINDGKYYFKSYDAIQEEMGNSKIWDYYKDNDEFTRIDVQGTTRNESLYIGHYSASEYLSILNGNITEIYKKNAMVAEMYGSVHYLIGLGGRGAIEDLLSVRYYDAANGDEVVDNKDYLPFGITYKDYILEIEAEELTAIQKNGIVLDKVVINQMPGYGIATKSKEVKNEILFIPNYKVRYENIVKTGDTIQVTGDSKIILEIDSKEAGECYVYAEKMKLNEENGIEVGHVYFDTVYCEFKGSKAAYSHGVDEMLICLGDIGEGIRNYTISFKENAIYEISSFVPYVIRTGIQDEYNQQRREHVLENVVMNYNNIQGEIYVPEEQILFVSIPYSSGWSAFVNGKQVELLRANYGFTALKLDAGNNQVEFQYRLPGLRVGSILSGVALIVLIYLMIKDYYFQRVYFEVTSDK